MRYIARKSKRNAKYAQLGQLVRSDSKTSAYVTSNQSVQYKIGPLDGPTALYMSKKVVAHCRIVIRSRIIYILGTYFSSTVGYFTLHA